MLFEHNDISSLEIPRIIYLKLTAHQQKSIDFVCALLDVL